MFTPAKNGGKYSVGFDLLCKG